jgi:hypothetical protein
MTESSIPKSSRRNPAELVDRYLQAVRFWMPKTTKQDGLLAELGEDLRSQMDDKETELARPLDQAEVAAILKHCGSPMVVAGRLGPKRYLIGPSLFPIYAFVLKMVLLWILVPVFLFIIGPVNLGNSAGDWGRAAVSTLGDLWTGLFIAGGIITFIFAVLERTHALAGIDIKWDPSSLPPLQKPGRRTSFVHTFCEVMFGCIGLVWLLLAPHYPALIFGPAAAFMRPGPLWHAFYLPILALSIVAIVRPAITLSRPQWNLFPTAAQLVQILLTLIVLHFMIRAVTDPANMAMHQLIVLTDAAKGLPQYIRVAAIVNASLLVSLASSWIGLCIALIVHSWRMLRIVMGRGAAKWTPVSLILR